MLKHGMYLIFSQKCFIDIPHNLKIQKNQSNYENKMKNIKTARLSFIFDVETILILDIILILKTYLTLGKRGLENLIYLTLTKVEYEPA